MPMVSASRGTRVESPPNHSALPARVSSSSVARVGACGQGVGGLVEADVAIGANAENHQVDAAGGGDGAFVALAFLLEIRRAAVEKPDVVSAQVDVIEQPLVCMKRDSCRRSPVPRPTNSSRLKVRTLDQSTAFEPSQPRQLRVQRERRAAGRQAEHERRMMLNRLNRRGVQAPPPVAPPMKTSRESRRGRARRIEVRRHTHVAACRAQRQVDGPSRRLDLESRGGRARRHLRETR